MIEHAPRIGCARYIISATTPLSRDDLPHAMTDLPALVSRVVPGWASVYTQLGWRLPRQLDRIYDNAKARAELNWQPRHDFRSMLAAGGYVRGDLAAAVGSKGYHRPASF